MVTVLLIMSIAMVIQSQGGKVQPIRVAVAQVRTDKGISVLYHAENVGPGDVVLLSPESLSRIYDSQECTLTLSGKVRGRPGDYSFEPKLEPLTQGQGSDFR